MKTRTLRDVCELIVDCEHKTAPVQETGYPSIRTPNIGRGRLILGGVNRVSRQVYKEWTRRAKPRAGDLILAREAPVGNVAIVPEELQSCLGQRTVLIRPDHQQVVPQYLVYLLLGDEVQARFHAYASGATVPHLNMRDIRNLVLPRLPPLCTQREIAAVLSAYDDLIENNTRRIAILEEMARLIYREWFVHFRFPGHEDMKMVDSELGPIPDGWEVRTLGETCDLVVGQSPKSEFYNEHGDGLPFHQGVTHFGRLYPTTWVYCTVEKRIAEPGDILLSVRAPVGRINVADRRMVIGRGLHAIRSKTETQTLTLLQLKERFRDEDTMGSGTIFKAVTKSDVLGLQLLAPPLDIIADFQRIVDPAFCALANLTQKSGLLRSARDLLLPRLVHGNIDVSGLHVDSEGVKQ
jgi:type I restriction enzyme S subunit